VTLEASLRALEAQWRKEADKAMEYDGIEGFGGGKKASALRKCADELATLPLPPEQESPVLAFDAWLTAHVQATGKKLTQDEYFLAQAAFYAAHPGEGPQSALMAPPAPEPEQAPSEMICPAHHNQICRWCARNNDGACEDAALGTSDERSALREQIAQLQQAFDELHLRCSTLAAEKSAAEAALRVYGQHTPECGLDQNKGWPPIRSKGCTCKFDQALQGSAGIARPERAMNKPASVEASLRALEALETKMRALATSCDPFDAVVSADVLEWADELAALRQALPPEKDNHHNALTCPYCNPKGLKFAEPQIKYPCGCTREYCPTHKPSYLPAAPPAPEPMKTTREEYITRLRETTAAVVERVRSAERLTSEDYAFTVNAGPIRPPAPEPEQAREMCELLRAFEPAISSRIPRPSEVLAKIRELQASDERPPAPEPEQIAGGRDEALRVEKAIEQIQGAASDERPPAPEPEQALNAIDDLAYQMGGSPLDGQDHPHVGAIRAWTDVIRKQLTASDERSALRAVQSENAELHALLEYVEDATAGRASDFALSFNHVRAIDDIRRRTEAAEAKCTAFRDQIAQLQGDVQHLLDTCIPLPEYEEQKQRAEAAVAQLQAFNSELVKAHNALLLDGARWQSRAEAAEAALRVYGQHKPECHLRTCKFIVDDCQRNDGHRCTCGFDQVQQGSAGIARPEEPET